MTSLTVDSSRRPALGFWKKVGLAAVAAATAFCGATASASAETRALKLYFVHTKEKAEIVFKRNGRFDKAGLKQINRLLRDWRRNEPTNMDPRLMDVVWEAYRQSGSRAYIHVVSAYRSPATNNMLRNRSRGVAKKSQHMLGKAMDWYVPDVPLKRLRDIGLKLQAGGVGYYPRSGSPFVHFDVGNVRHWPGISRSELARVFPQGKTLHVPSDGKPLPGYEQALAAYKVRQTKGDLAIASLASAPAGSAKKSRGGLLAMWFGGGADQEEDDSESVMPAPVVKATPRRQAAPEPEIAIRSPDQARPASRQPEITVLPPDQAAPAAVGRNGQPLPDTLVPESPEAVEDMTPEAIIAALPRNRVPKPVFASRPDAILEPEEIADQQLVAAVVPAARPSADVAVASAPTPAPKPAETLEAQGWQTGPAALRTASVEPQAGIPAQAFAAVDGGSAGKLPPGWSTGKQGVAAPEEKIVRPKAPVGAAVEATKTGRLKASKKKPEVKAQLAPPAPTPLANEEVPAQVTTAAMPTKQGRKSARVLVRSAPEQVYSNGFQQTAEASDPNRFTGNAVEFLAVSKFKK